MLAPLIFCEDGTLLSVQVSEGHYCTPRNDTGPWTHVEVGYMENNQVPSRWKEFAEDASDMAHTIFAQVPLFEIQLYIGMHGGINFPVTLAYFEMIMSKQWDNEADDSAAFPSPSDFLQSSRDAGASA